MSAPGYSETINVPNDFPTIQEAVEAAKAGDYIVIEPGIYTGAANRDVSFMGKAITITGTDPHDADVIANTIIDCEESGRGFMFISGEGQDSVLTGLTIRNGLALDGGGVECLESSPAIHQCVFIDNTALRHGGAIHIEGGAPTIDGCSFIGNVCDFEITGTGCGGALYIHDGARAITNCFFDSNMSLGAHGGAIGVDQQDLSLSLCTFQNNTAWLNGGAVFATAVMQLSIDQCTFDTNSAFTAAGGAISVVAGEDVSILTSHFDGNSAIGGGAVSLTDAAGSVLDTEFVSNLAEDGGAIRAGGTTILSLHGCQLQQNRAIPCGGGAIWNSAEVRLIDCQLVDNQADEFDGGAILNTPAGVLALIDCTLAENTSDLAGGAVKNEGLLTASNCLWATNYAEVMGGGLANAGDGLLINCTATANRTSEFGSGGAVHASSGAIVVMNSILWANEDADGQVESSQLSVVGGIVDVRYSCIQGLTESLDGIGNIDADPMFVSPLGDDGDAQTYEDNDYHLLGDSPCIDAGVNLALPMDTDDRDADGDVRELLPLDLDGSPRVTDHPKSLDTGCGAPAIVDMGVYELAGPNVEIYLGDITGDGVVNAADLAMLLGSWGPCAIECCPADLNLDGAVDVMDLGDLLGNWG